MKIKETILSASTNTSTWKETQYERWWMHRSQSLDHSLKICYFCIFPNQNQNDRIKSENCCIFDTKSIIHFQYSSESIVMYCDNQWNQLENKRKKTIRWIVMIRKYWNQIYFAFSHRSLCVQFSLAMMMMMMIKFQNEKS